MPTRYMLMCMHATVHIYTPDVDGNRRFRIRAPLFGDTVNGGLVETGGVACERSTKLWSSSVVCEASWSAKVSDVIRFL